MEDECSMEQHPSIVHSDQPPPQTTGIDTTYGGVDNEFNSKWEEHAGKMIYNVQSNTLDLGNLQATQYKHNKHVFLLSESAVMEILTNLVMSTHVYVFCNKYLQ